MDNFDGAGPVRRRPGWVLAVILFVAIILVVAGVWLLASYGLTAMPDLNVQGF